MRCKSILLTPGLCLSANPGAAEEGLPEMVVTATRVERELFNTPRAVTLVDGVRLNNSYYRFGPHQYLNTIDPNLIERIEVVRGPTSVLYGSDALGGTINIITRKRADFSTSGKEIIEGDTSTLETRGLTDVWTLVASLQLTNVLNDANRLTYGLEYYRDEYDTRKDEVDLNTGILTPIIPGTPDGAEYSSFGLYLQDEIRLGERADAILGLRYIALWFRDASGFRSLSGENGSDNMRQSAIDSDNGRRPSLSQVFLKTQTAEKYLYV